MDKKKKSWTPKKTAILVGCLAAVLAVVGVSYAFGVAAGRNAAGTEAPAQLSAPDAAPTPAVSTETAQKDEPPARAAEPAPDAAAQTSPDAAPAGQTPAAPRPAPETASTTAAAPAAAATTTPPDAGTSTADAPAATAAPATTITAERAQEIALQHAGVSADNVPVVRTKLDFDDGVQVYDVEFYQGGTEYDYEIDAATGAVRSYDFDAEDYRPAPAQTPDAAAGSAAYLGVDRAKSIAVAHAGLALSDAVFQKAKLENDDGRAEYEIEFYKDGVEYEYTIDAVSGDVLEYDAEYDD